MIRRPPIAGACGARALVLIMTLPLGLALDTASSGPPKPPASPGTPQGLPAAYERMLDDYRLGDIRQAVIDLSAFNAEQLRQLATQWLGPPVGGPGRVVVSDRKRLAVAAMLHTDCAFSLYLSGALAAASTHLDLARRLLEAAEPDPAATGSFRRRWYLATLMFLHRENRPAVAGKIRAMALEAFPDDAPILLEAGAIDEESGTSLEPTPLYLMTEAGLDKARALRQGYLISAEAFLTRALQADSTLTEATLRLARVRAERGRPDEAVRALEVLLGLPQGPEIRYMASMLLGQLRERENRLDDAAAHYRDAIATWPRSQASRTALAHVLVRQGLADDAAAVARDALGMNFDAGEVDPWWRYPRSQFRSFDELLTGLRQEARR